MGEEQAEVVLREDGDGFVILRMNRPARRNALSAALIEGLTSALEALNGDPKVRAIILTGEGASFCAGGDLAGGMMGAGGAVAAHEGRAAFGRLFHSMRGHSAILIAAVNGDALGGGLGLAACCDMVVSDPKARFGTPEIKLGLFPWVIMAVLNRHVGQKRLMEMLMLGQKIPAAEALSIGLINRLSEEGEAVEAATQLAIEVASQAPVPLRLGKSAFYQVADQDFDASLQFLNTQLTLNLLTEDAMEGVGAFMQRRKPEWKGR